MSQGLYKAGGDRREKGVIKLSHSKLQRREKPSDSQALSHFWTWWLAPGALQVHAELCFSGQTQLFWTCREPPREGTRPCTRTHPAESANTQTHVLPMTFSRELGVFCSLGTSLLRFPELWLQANKYWIHLFPETQPDVTLVHDSCLDLVMKSEIASH